MTTLHGYQQDAVDWMDIREQDKKTPGGFLCHEMGLGKTVMMSAHIAASLRRAPRTLLLTTKSTVNSWTSTLRTFSNFRFNVLDTLKRPPPPGYPFVIVATHQSILNWRIVLPTVDRIVVDEAHVMRNQGRLFYKMLDIAGASRFRWGITATPYNNHDSDMLAYVRFLRPTDTTITGKAFRHFFLRKTREEVAPTSSKLIVTKMMYDFETDDEKNLYDYVAGRIEDTHNWIQANGNRIPWRIRGHMQAVLTIRKRQAAIHPQLVLNAEKVWAREYQIQPHVAVQDWNPTRVTKVNKIAAMVTNDQKMRHSTMIVTHFRDELLLIKERLEEMGVRVEVIDGKTSVKKRHEIETQGSSLSRAQVSELMLRANMKLPVVLACQIADFVVPPPTVVLLQIQAGGVGLSLPWVHHVINAAPDWNPFLEKQSMYRAYRINTKHDVHVTQLYFRDTIEIDMEARQQLKLSRGEEWLTTA